MSAIVFDDLINKIEENINIFVEKVDSCLYQNANLFTDLEKSINAEQKSKVLKESVVCTLIDLFGTLAPSSPQLIKLAFGSNQIDSSQTAQMGFDFATNLMALHVQGIKNSINKDNYKNILWTLLVIMSYYAIEKAVDDLAVFDFKKENSFRYKDIVKNFNHTAVKLIKSELKLEEGIEKIAKDLDIQTETELSKILVKLQKLSSGLELPKDTKLMLSEPHKSLLALNMIGIYLVSYKLDENTEDTNEFKKWLRSERLKSLEYRYSGVTNVLDNPTLPIEESILIRNKTILTRFSFYSLLEIIYSYNKSDIEEYKNQIVEYIDVATDLVGLLNDGGGILHLRDAKNALISLSPDYMTKHPRELFSTLQIPEKSYFSRLVKDSKEGEYNILLNSLISFGLDYKECWEMFFHNLEYAKHFYCEKVLRFDWLSRGLSKNPLLKDFVNAVQMFVQFNEELYIQRDGDYDILMDLSELPVMGRE